jgi:hypothetical protein
MQKSVSSLRLEWVVGRIQVRVSRPGTSIADIPIRRLAPRTVRLQQQVHLATKYGPNAHKRERLHKSGGLSSFLCGQSLLSGPVGGRSFPALRTPIGHFPSLNLLVPRRGHWGGGLGGFQTVWRTCPILARSADEMFKVLVRRYFFRLRRWRLNVPGRRSGISQQGGGPSGLI